MIKTKGKMMLAVAAIAAAVLVAACARSGEQPAAVVPTGRTNANADAQVVPASYDSANASTEARPAAFRTEFTAEPREVRAGAPATLAFTVKNSSGETVRDLEIVHEKPLHLLVVSDDLSEFYHIHPVQQADGSYRVAHTFPHGGRYKLYADFTPLGGAQVVDRFDLQVSGTSRPRVALTPDRTKTKTVAGLRVGMSPSRELRAGQELMLDFATFDARTGRPATDLQNYLGELAHFVIISEDAVDFLHAHPMARGAEGHGGHGDSNAAPHAHGNGAQGGTSEVSAHTTFPRAGLYKVWAQFQRSNQVITVPFVLRVAEGQPATATGAQPAVPS
ncbi:MAG: hypothetical protein M3R15_02780, partial [Acidobacteriota bacterium]|nr:hypothetical protein [Acidobacteriota bacterium]